MKHEKGSLRGMSRKRGICEVLRLINDRAQGDSEKDREIRDLIAEASNYATRMSLKLREYNTEYDKEWYKRNEEYIENHPNDRRREMNYKVGSFNDEKNTK
jgi:hypothetical protein